ncbi:unnamed protein product [Closterium sp. NIES-54]
MSDSLPIDSVSAPPSAASPTDLHHRTRLGTQYNDACPPVNSRVAGGADETRADPGSSSGGGGGGAAWTPFRRDLVVLGAAFLALFAAYSAIQNLETSLHPRAGMGAVSLAVIYGGIVVFAPLAPAVIRYLRPRGAMLVGMSGYCAYIAANAVDSSAQLGAAAVRGVPGRERVRAVGGAGALQRHARARTRRRRGRGGAGGDRGVQRNLLGNVRGEPGGGQRRRLPRLPAHGSPLPPRARCACYSRCTFSSESTSHYSHGADSHVSAVPGAGRRADVAAD